MLDVAGCWLLAAGGLVPTTTITLPSPSDLAGAAVHPPIDRMAAHPAV
jgi:hypothetical protein